MKSTYKTVVLIRIIGLIPQVFQLKQSKNGIWTALIGLIFITCNCQSRYNLKIEIDTTMQNEYYNIDEVDLPPIFLTEDNTNSNENKLNFDRSYFTFIRKVAKEIESHSIPNEEFIYKVDVEFIIDRTGSLVNPQFYNKDNSKLTDIQKLILHTLSIPQKWEPGLKNGKAVNTKMRLFFHLSPN